jgi:hypothetical protein
LRSTLNEIFHAMVERLPSSGISVRTHLLARAVTSFSPAPVLSSDPNQPEEEDQAHGDSQQPEQDEDHLNVSFLAPSAVRARP